VRVLGRDASQRLRDRVLVAHLIGQVPAQFGIAVEQRDCRGAPRP
jgi:hypothetical protein